MLMSRRRLLQTATTSLAAPAVIASGSTISSARASDFAPAITLQSMLDIRFYETGLISFGDIDLAFAPEAPINLQVAVGDKDGNIVGQHSYFPDPRYSWKVFSRIPVVGPADVTITTPGIYNIFYFLDGQPITRMPIVLKQTGDGSDPFDPDKTYAFDGLWRQLAYVTMNDHKGKPFPEFTAWLGEPDMVEKKHAEMFIAALVKDGAIVAHTRRTTGSFSSGHFSPQKFTLYHPHPREKTPNAIVFTMDDFPSDGEYSLRIFRQSDEQAIRNYMLVIENGAIKQHQRAALGYQPAIDYIVPRAVKRGSSVYEFVEAIWLDS